ncbi:MAG: cbb3-type cytochrome oxidase subunit 3 [Pseudomonadota bacterium]
MDINTWRGIATVLAFGAFIGVCWWIFGVRSKKSFDEAANLPFADDAHDMNSRKSDKGMETKQ